METDVVAALVFVDIDDALVLVGHVLALHAIADQAGPLVGREGDLHVVIDLIDREGSVIALPCD